MGHLTDVISTMRGGAADRAASDLLRTVVERVQATGKKGSVTIKLEICMLKDGDGEMEVKAKLSHSVPTNDIPSGVYYRDKKTGTLVKEDPRQLSMIEDGDENTIDLGARRMGERKFPGVTGDDL